MWAQTPGTHPTAEEVEVARILSRLSENILEYDRRSQPASIWGAKRKRSALSDYALRPHDRDRGGEPPNEGGSVVASSPATPLSFYPSGGEEAADDPRGLPVMRPQRPPPPPPPPPTCRKPFKNAKRHREWVKEQNQAISSLAAEGVNLKRLLEEAKGLHRMLKARNLWMREMHLKLLWVEIGDREAPPQPQQREQQVYGQSNSVGLVLPVGPAALLPLLSAACDQRGSAEPAALPIAPLPPSDAAAAAVTQDFQHAAAAEPAERSRVVLDLNSSAEAAEERLELGLGLGWQPSGHSTAEARRRRIKIRRDKGGGAHSSMTYHQDKIYL